MFQWETLAWLINDLLCLKAWLGKGPKGAEHISGFKQNENWKLKTNWKMPIPESRPAEVPSTHLPAGSTKQWTLLRFCPAVSLSGNDQFIMLKQTVLIPRQIKPKQVNWWNKYAFNSAGKMKVPSVSAPGSNLTEFSALSATPPYTVIYLCSKYCGRIMAGWCVRCCTNIT